MDEAVSTAAETLEVEYCNVLELLPDGNVLLLRAGVGWQEGFVGHATVSASRYSQAGYTLLSDAPVIVEDIRTVERFSAAPLLREHGVVSGMSTIIRGRERPFGVLGAHAKELRSFTEDDISFLRVIANVLAAAIERARAEERLHDVKEAERGRIARDLHDVVLQDLAQAIQELETARRLLPPEERPDASFEGTVEALRRSVRNLREVV
jgi:GAF domain-containing protein